MTPTVDASAKELVEYVQHALIRAASDPKDSWRLPTLITASEGRLVVLRGIDKEAGAWTFYTDIRSPKVAQLTTNSGEVSATFYHHKDRTQLRLKGVAVSISEVERLKIWAELSVEQKSSYATSLAPGSTIVTASCGLSESWSKGKPTITEEKLAFMNFAAYSFQIKDVELLLLHRDGHRRCSWTGWTGDNFFWMIP